MKIFLLFQLYFYSQALVASEFSLSFYPDKSVVKYPSSDKKKGKVAIVVFDNKLMSNLVIQVVDEDGSIISNLVVGSNRLGSINFEKNKGSQYFVVPLQPAAEKIPLVYTGRQIEIP